VVDEVVENLLQESGRAAHLALSEEGHSRKRELGNWHTVDACGKWMLLTLLQMPANHVAAAET